VSDRPMAEAWEPALAKLETFLETQTKIQEEMMREQRAHANRLTRLETRSEARRSHKDDLRWLWGAGLGALALILSAIKAFS